MSGPVDVESMSSTQRSSADEWAAKREAMDLPVSADVSGARRPRYAGLVSQILQYPDELCAVSPPTPAQAFAERRWSALVSADGDNNRHHRRRQFQDTGRKSMTQTEDGGDTRQNVQPDKCGHVNFPRPHAERVSKVLRELGSRTRQAVSVVDSIAGPVHLQSSCPISSFDGTHLRPMVRVKGCPRFNRKRHPQPFDVVARHDFAQYLKPLCSAQPRHEELWQGEEPFGPPRLYQLAIGPTGPFGVPTSTLR